MFQIKNIVKHKLFFAIGLCAFVGLHAAASEPVDLSEVNVDGVVDPSPAPDIIHNSHQLTFTDIVAVQVVSSQPPVGVVPAPVAHENCCCQCLAYLCWPETCFCTVGVGISACPCVSCLGCFDTMSCFNAELPCVKGCAQRANGPCLSAMNCGLCCAEYTCYFCGAAKTGYAMLREPFNDEIARRQAPGHVPAMR